MDNITLEKVGPENLSNCGIGCLTNPKNQGYHPKIKWLQKRFAEGLRLLLCRDEKGKPLAFLEYVPGEYAWRPVDAKVWLFVHCLWVYPKGQKVGGLGSRLIRACIEEAQQADTIGVAAMVSDGAWIAGKKVFLKNGFRQIAAADRFQLVIHRLKKGPEPHFRDISGSLAKYRGLHIVYSAQCLDFEFELRFRRIPWRGRQFPLFICLYHYFFYNFIDSNSLLGSEVYSANNL